MSEIKLPVRYDANEMTIWDADDNSLGFFTPNGSDVDAIGNAIADALNTPREPVAVDGLLPCPFCGKRLAARTHGHNPHARCATEGCKASQLPVLNLDSPGDILAWNTRQSAERERELVEALERLRDCDWVISLPDRMDAVRKIARDALAHYNGEPVTNSNALAEVE